METLTSLLPNLGLLSLAAVLVFVFSIRIGQQVTGYRLAIMQGIIYGLTSMLVVSFPIQGPGGTFFDTRSAPILIAGYFGGPIAGVIAATIGAFERYLVGGPFVWGGVASFYAYLATALLWRRIIGVQPLSALKYAGMGITATVMVLPTFFLGPSIEAGWDVLQSFWYVLLAGVLIGTILLGMIVSRIMIFMNRQQEHQATIESSADGIVTVNASQLITAVNPAAEKMFGWTAEELIGREVSCLVPTEHKSKHPEFASNFVEQQNVTSRRMTEYRTIQALCKDGSTFPVLISLAKFQSSGQTMVVATIHDMTEIQETRKKLEEMTETLAVRLKESLAANEGKNLFLANMSHELRTPLNAIIGFASLVEYIGSANLKHCKIDEYIADIKSSGEALLLMINDVLDLSKIESGRTDLVIEQQSVNHIISSAVLLAKVNAQKNRITLQCPESIDTSISCDVRTLKQALLNLLTNAIKYSPKNSTVRVYAETTSTSVRLVVEDNGFGIPDNVINCLGEPFLRGDSEEVQNIEGTGLGLAITKKFVERQNGKLSLEKRREGGTIAIITMPLEPTASIATADKPLVSA